MLSIIQFPNPERRAPAAVDWRARALALQYKLDALREYACVCGPDDLESAAILEIIDGEYTHG